MVTAVSRYHVHFVFYHPTAEVGLGIAWRGYAFKPRHLVKIGVKTGYGGNVPPERH